MMQPNLIRSALLVLSLVLLPAVAIGWSDDPYVNDLVCGDAAYQYNPHAISDGNGGVIIAWVDHRSGGSLIYAQRLDADGVPIWPTNGVRVCTWDSWQDEHQIVTDDAGGAIIVWEDAPDELGTEDLFAQRIGPNGNRLWASTGQGVCTAATAQTEVALTADGSGGVFAVWRDGTSPTTDIYAQHLNSSGVRAWATAGAPVCTAIRNQKDPECVLGNVGDLYCCWLDFRNDDYKLYMQRLAPTGVPLWEVDGRSAMSLTGHHESFNMVEDGSGGFIVGGIGILVDGAVELVQAQHVDGAGTRLWGTDGREVHYATNLFWTRTVADGSGGAGLFWSEDVDGVFVERGQRLASNGDFNWVAEGVVVSGTDPLPYSTFNHAVVADGMGGFIATWSDDRYEVRSIFAQHLGPAGEHLWVDRGQLLTRLELDFPYRISLVTVTPEALVATWDTQRDGNDDIFAQYVHPSGFLGMPLPVLTSVSDFPDDQGGEVEATWTASPLDTYPGTNIESYSLWVQEVVAGARHLDATERARLARELPLAQAKVDELDRDGWLFVTEVPAVMEAEYSALAPTFGDSTEAGIPWVKCRVIAHTANPWSYLESDPLAGYSVDNFAPGAPLNLAGELAGDLVDLVWEASGHHDEDLAHYRVYRGDISGFPIDEAHFIGTSVTETYTDEPGDGTWYYRCTGVDVHGNEGEASNEAIVDVTTDVIEGPLPTSFALRGGWPNPFNPRTTLYFDLPRATKTTVTICDPSGRKVATLVDQVLPAGAHAQAWDGKDDAGRSLPSGVYLARLEAGSFTATHRLVLLK